MCLSNYTLGKKWLTVGQQKVNHNPVIFQAKMPDVLDLLHMALLSFLHSVESNLFVKLEYDKSPTVFGQRS